MKNKSGISFIIILLFAYGLNAQDIVLRYNPSVETAGSTSISDVSGNGNSASLINGAQIAVFEEENVIDLGTSNGYADLGSGFGSVVSGLSDYSVFCKVYIPSTSYIGGNGNFVWTFSNSNDIANDANGCLFFSAKNSRYAISLSNWTGESGIQTGSALSKGAWKYVVYVQDNGTAYLYIDGFLVKSGAITLTPSELGSTAYNYLGRSCYSSDAYLDNAKYADFRIYNAPLTTAQVEELSGISNDFGDAELLLEYEFSSTSDTEGNYSGTLQNGAELIQIGEHSVLSLGEDNGYFDLGSSLGTVISALDSFSVTTSLFIPENTSITANGNFIWTFANSDDMINDKNGNMFFSAISTRYAITKTVYTEESVVNAGVSFPKGRWINLSYLQVNGRGYVYLDSVMVASALVGVKPMELGSTSFNYLGRSCYQGDAYVKNAMYSNFRMYKGAVSEEEIILLCREVESLNFYIDSVFVEEAAKTIFIANADSIRSRIDLSPNAGEGVAISWQSSNDAVVSNDGMITRPAVGSDPVTVTLYATFSRNGYSFTKEYQVKVLPFFSDEKSVSMDISALKIGGTWWNARTKLHLPHSTLEGSVVYWETDSPDYLNADGRVMQLAKYGEGKKEVILTAYASKGEESQKKEFTVYVAEEDNADAYLFSYFTGNSQTEEQIHFALSYDGYEYIPLNNGNPVISSADIALKEAVRDPHILRCEDGETFYMVVTDMKSSEGWSSNRGIVLLKSTDLVNWTSSAIHFPDRWPDDWANVIRVWAPQTIYDQEAGKYMVYFSMRTDDGKLPYDKIFYCYANEGFTDLEGDPVYMYDRGSATIDGDIVFSEADSLYHFFYKNEGSGGICKVTSERLSAEPGMPAGSNWSEPSDNLEQTTEAVEGAGVFRLINSDEWVLMYDCYGAGHYQFCNSENLSDFSFVMDNYSMDARHGTTIRITAEEAERLAAAFPSTALSELTIIANNSSIKPEGIIINEGAAEIIIPVYYGTDLTSFDPGFYATPGTEISPSGSQDFSSGSKSYSFTLNGTTANYIVKVEIRVNPVLPGFRADPEVLYSEKTERFYIYPTSDGFTGWGGYYFDVFSSPDLVNWTNEGTFLDLSTSQVAWASGNAWAPCIIEKKIAEDQYRYYFYFSGESDGKKTGVAVSDHPTGPFTDLGEPMISVSPANGQIIDSDVFKDPVSGEYYFYWGNGYMAVAKLNEDMTSIDEESIQVITPEGGSLSTYAYREAPYVFYRNGKYYFLWSVDDTGSPNYHVAYGTSDSPMGPIDVADEPIVMIADYDSLIYGTAHNSILQIPGRDEWYIVYHRINKDYLNDGPGYHREVCIDRMYFNEDGTIKPVDPTHRGIDTIMLHMQEPVNAVIDKKIDRKKKSEVLSIEYYNLQGQRLYPDALSRQTGIYFEVRYYADGEKETVKRLVIRDS